VFGGRSRFGWALLGGLVACSSSKSGDNPPPTGGALCTTRDPGPSPLRRLTRVEYGRTLGDLIGPGLVDTSGLPPDERALGFDNNADVLGSSDLLIEQYQDLAERAAVVVTGDLGRFVPCAGTIPDDACARTFIVDFGRRAWRRPLADAEIDGLLAVFTGGQTDVGFGEGVARTVEVLLQSPQFLYRIEVNADPVPEPVADLPGAVHLTPFETATRLSYLIWRSMPDQTLAAAADTDRLSTAADLAREARRLLKDPRAHDVVASFHASWLGLDKIDDLDKDQVVYPMFNPSLRASFRAETTRFIDEVIWNREGTLHALLTARYTFVDAGLAAFYGLATPAGADWQHVALDPMRRAGLLTQPSFLAVHAKANQTSPVHRGRFVREQLFCTTPPPPPPNIEIRPPVLDPRMTTRERFAQHTADAFCAGCHSQLDPIGFGFEHYDGIGRWRDTESGLVVDASGSLSNTDVDGVFDGAVALADRLGRSAEVADCYATQWFRFGYGRGETAADACSVGQLAGSLSASGGDVRELLVALTQTDAFRYRRTGGSP
jgi:Protein of unknown function (DUF1592)/Protein of unknown function (DUF1588)/Protein of unknown function (DUF1595)/Protein of unknown function (DUF1587)/Protein of unknown function (DUF1585)